MKNKYRYVLYVRNSGLSDNHDFQLAMKTNRRYELLNEIEHILDLGDVDFKVEQNKID